MAQKKLKLKAKLLVFMGVIVLTAAITTGAIALVAAYQYRFSTAVQKDGNIKVYPRSTLDEVIGQLYTQGFINSPDKMKRFAARNKIYEFKDGNYDLKRGISFRTLLNILAAGRQTPIRLTFNNFRTVDRLIGAVAKKTLSDSVSLMDVMNDDDLLRGKGFNRRTVISMFIPNTYEVYWNITPLEFFERMNGEYMKFWNEDRHSKASSLGLSPIEVSIIASIVDSETTKTDEMTNVAGVYINRLRRNMPLQADPTVKFAIGDFTIKRVLNKHLEYDSPYNTYQNTGLPPGPICMSSIAAIDATLSYTGHDYLYFCARADFSGYHSFARTLAEHSENARRYQYELNRLKIK